MIQTAIPSVIALGDSDRDEALCRRSQDTDRVKTQTETQGKTRVRIRQFIFPIQLDTDSLRDTQDFL